MKQENEKLISGEETQPEEPMTPGGNSRALPPFIPIIRPDDPIDPGDPEDPDEPEETAIIGGDFVKNGADMQEGFGTHSSFDVNLYKGKLFFTQHLFTAEGLHLPASFSLAYNTRFVDTDYVHSQTTMFKGWKLNYQQFIRFADNKCVYVDGAFKEHIFEKSTNNANVYLDTSTRSGAILKPVSGGHEIFDGANTTLLFKNNRLVKITQKKGEEAIETTIAYTSDRVSQITDGLGNTYSVNYTGDTITITDSTNAVLATLTADSNNRFATVKYYEDDSRLTEKKCLFNYNSSTHRLTSVQDQLALEKVSFAYNTAGKLTSLKKYASNSNGDTPLQSVFLTYNTGNTIVSKNNGTDTNYEQIRYKYTFNTVGAVTNSCEIDSSGNPIGKQTFISYANGAETHTTYEDEECITLLDDSWPVSVGPGVLIGDPIEVCSETFSIENALCSHVDVDFSWKLDYEDYFLPYPDSIILVELFVNNALVCSREYPVAETISMTDTCTVTSVATAEEMTVRMLVTAPYSEQPVSISNVQAKYRPLTKTEKRMYIRYTPYYDIMFAPPVYITETVHNEDKYWFPAEGLTFSTSSGDVAPSVFSYDDYQKTMLSYFRDPTKFNLYYDQGTKVVYETTFLNTWYEDQEIPINQIDLAFVATTKRHRTFEQVAIEDSLFKIYHRRENYAYESNYVQLDNFLRLKKEYQIGSDAKSYTYDNYGNVISTFVGGVIESSTFSTDGQKLTAVPNHITEDSQTEYTYDGTGILSSMQLPNGQDVSFAYQNRTILNRVSANVGGVINENTITYDGAFITNVTHNDTTFVYQYDNRNSISKVFVKTSSNCDVSATDIPLIDKATTYSTNGSYSTQLTYANGYTVKHYFDKYDRLVRISSVTSTGESPLATYIYADNAVASGAITPNYSATSISLLRKAIDNCTSLVYNYTYNEDKICTKVETSNLTKNLTYDAQGRVYQKQVEVGSSTITAAHSFENDFSSVLSSETTVIDGQITTTQYTRNGANLPTTIARTAGDSFEIEQNYTYKPWSETNPQTYIIPLVTSERTQKVLNGVAQPVENKIVAYDANGNITQYGSTTYEYDGLNRLVRENNQELGKTFVWTYDAGGNITSRTKYNYTPPDEDNLGAYISQDEYRYNNSWKDQLTYFHNVIECPDCDSQNDNIRAIDPVPLCLYKGISYDKSGNPTAYRGNAFVWSRGSLLTQATLKDGRVIDISYDAQGRRKSKTKGAIYHNYTYDQGKLVQLRTNFGGDSATLTFIYDSQGVQGFTYNNRVYHYVKNLFGDVTDIYCGSTHIVHYTYDAFGNHTVNHFSDDLSWIGNGLIGTVNPFKYRSQLYDEDLGFYYIQGRYYDHAIGRFISSARVSNLNPQAINGLNLYSYAGNNPIAAYQVVTNSNTYANRNSASSRASNAVAESSTPSKASLPKFPDELQYLSYVDDVVTSVLHISIVGKYLFGYGKAHTITYLAEMRLFGVNPTNGLMSLPKASWIGAISSLFAVIDTTMSVYNNIQEGDSFGEILLDGALTFGISWGAAWLGGVIGSNIGGAVGAFLGSLIPIPGVGSFIGFVVGTAVSLLVTWLVKDALSYVKEGLLDAIFG